ncbi:unnamed protein product [Soboliphyme baturini]|uniref:Polyprotein n=1 Tax=Soboliphyme baturini TaxID=241478 RepID=A0A183IH73_9BILA|nr:unnamed protein product [Soboliphyme baturini]
MKQNRWILSQGDAIDFEIEKRARPTIKRERIAEPNDIKLKDGRLVKSLDKQEDCKHLSILQTYEIPHAVVMKKTNAEYIRRLRKILNSSLIGGNTMKSSSAEAIAVIRYCAGIADWTQVKLDTLDCKTWKIMTANQALHPSSDIDQLYVVQRNGGRGLLWKEAGEIANSHIDGSCKAALELVQEVRVAVCETLRATAASVEEEGIKDPGCDWVTWRNVQNGGKLLDQLRGDEVMFDESLLHRASDNTAESQLSG